MHDKNGKPLAVGDKVTVSCTIKNCSATEDYCNVEVETDEVMYPGEHKSNFHLNAKQVEKV